MGEMLEDLILSGKPGLKVCSSIVQMIEFPKAITD